MIWKKKCFKKFAIFCITSNHQNGVKEGYSIIIIIITFILYKEIGFSKSYLQY